MSVNVQRLSFHSPLGTSFFLFPFLFSHSALAAPCYGIKLSKVEVQTRALGGGGAEHFFPSEKLSSRTAFALRRISCCGLALSIFRDFRNFYN